MSGTIGGATYILTFQNQSVIQGMQQTQQQVAQSSQQIAQSLQQMQQALNASGQAAANATGFFGGGYGGAGVGGGPVGGAISTALGGNMGLVGALTSVVTGVSLATFALREIKDTLSFVGEGVLEFNDKLAKSHLTWETFTGDTKAADAEVAALFEFSRKTPFTFEQVDAAARQLAAFGGTAFASKENLELLGNVAAGTQKPLQTITYEFGQMYQELENGQPFGRAARALVMFGALSAETRTQLEQMKAAGASNSEMLEVFTNDLDRFNGLIEKQATQTLSGAVTTLTDTLQSLIAVAGQEVFKAVLGDVNELNKSLESESALVYAKNIGIMVGEVVNGLRLIINGITFYINLMQGLISTLIITIGDGLEKLLRMMGQLPGGEMFQRQAEGIRIVTDAMRAHLRDINSALQEQGDNLVDAWSDMTNAKWAQAGEDAGGAFAGGFSAKFSAGDRDLQDAARKYIQGIGAAFRGLSVDQIGTFDDLTDFVSKILLGGGEDPDQIMQQIRPLLLQAIQDLHADVNQGLMALKNVLPPEIYQQVRDYITALQDAEIATNALKVATDAQNAAQDRYNQTVKDAKVAQDAATAAVERAENIRKANEENFNRQIQEQQTILQGLQREAEQEAARLSSITRAAQADLARLQEEVRRRAEEDARRVQEAQEEVDRRQRLMQEHEDAFQAILDGETARFLRQKGAIDATTQAILDRYNAEVEGKIRAAAGDDERVTRLEREEREKLLQLDTRIRLLRSQGHFQEADALQSQRDRVAAYYDDQIKFASQVAAVSKDKADEAKERVEKAAQDQKDTDQKNVDAAKTTLDNIKDEATARAAADKEALAQAQARVDAAQEEARRVAEDYKNRQQAIQDNIVAINQQKDAQKIRDDQAVAEAKAAKDIVDTIWTNAVAESKKQLDNAKDTTQAAKDAKTAADNHLDTMVKLTTEWEKQYKYALGILNAEREARGLEPLTFIPSAPPNRSQPGSGNGGPQEFLPGEGNTTAPPPSAPARPPSQPPPPSPPPPGRDNPHFIPGDITGFVPTLERPYPDGTWWDPKNGFIPDGYELRNGDFLYWVGTSSSGGSYYPEQAPGGSNYLRTSSLSAMLSMQTPGPISYSRSGAMGIYGINQPPESGAAGYNVGGIGQVYLDFSGATVDSHDRVQEIRQNVVSGIRQALNDRTAALPGTRVGRKI